MRYLSQQSQEKRAALFAEVSPAALDHRYRSERVEQWLTTDDRSMLPLVRCMSSTSWTNRMRKTNFNRAHFKDRMAMPRRCQAGSLGDK